MLPFTREQFLAVFVGYNEAVWPVELLTAALGVATVVAVLRPFPSSNRLVWAVTALMWLWTGIAYHVVFFAPINKAAYGFGALFVIQALSVFYHGVWRDSMNLAFTLMPVKIVGAAYLAYALLVYPLVGLFLGQAAVELPIFGVTPCPVTIFTLGLFLLADRLPKSLLPIPVLWSLIGGSAAFLLDVRQDWPLLVSGVVAAALRLIDDRTVGHEAPVVTQQRLVALPNAKRAVAFATPVFRTYPKLVRDMTSERLRRRSCEGDIAAFGEPRRRVRERWADRAPGTTAGQTGGAPRPRVAWTNPRGSRHRGWFRV